MSHQQHVYSRDTGKYLGPLTARWAQGEGFPDMLSYRYSPMQEVGIQADHAELRDAAPAPKKGRR